MKYQYEIILVKDKNALYEYVYKSLQFRKTDKILALQWDHAVIKRTFTNRDISYIYVSLEDTITKTLTLEELKYANVLVYGKEDAIIYAINKAIMGQYMQYCYFEPFTKKYATDMWTK